MIPTRSEQFDKIFDALIQAREEFPLIPKNQQTVVGKNPVTGKPIFRAYASFIDIYGTIEPILKANNLHITTDTTIVEGQHVAEVFILHRPSMQWMRSIYPIDIDGGKSAQQGRGMSQTYLLRYTIKNMLMLTLDDETDTDGEPVSENGEATTFHKSEVKQSSGSTKPPHISKLWSYIFKEEDTTLRSKLIKALSNNIGNPQINEFTPEQCNQAHTLLDKYFNNKG